MPSQGCTAKPSLVKAWTTPEYTHHGTFWQVTIPALRPQVYQKPHPPLIRACSGLESTLEMARHGRPFLMNIQSDEITLQRFDLYLLFFERAIDVLAEGGRLCFITPEKFEYTSTAEPLRRILSSQTVEQKT